VLAVAIMFASGCARPAARRPGTPLGHWEGRASFRGKAVPLAIDFTSDGDSLAGEFSSDALLILRKPLADVRFETPALRFVIQDADAPLTFEGRLSGDSLVGSLESGAFPDDAGPGPRLSLHRAAPPASAVLEEEVTFQGQGVELRGSLFRPSADGPHPGVVLLQGSTLNTRDHYRYYADRFARAGFVVLTFDKRGSGASGGSLPEATYDGLIADAIAAVHFLSSRPGVDPKRIGIWGMSQGGFLAPRVAQLVRASFVVSVSGPVEPIGEVAAWQDSVRVAHAGFSARAGHDVAEATRRLTRWADSEEGAEAIAPVLAAIARAPWAGRSALPREPPPEAERRGWYWRGRALDPWLWWEELTVPALVIYGERDELVPAERNAERLAPLLGSRRGGKSQVLVYPRTNHEIKWAPLRNEPFDWPHAPPDYMPTVVEWMRASAGLEPPA
jgi:dienelactone hydrolase